MKCPVCDFGRVGNSLRCPNCQSALTVWKNYSLHGRAAYRTGLRAVAEGDYAAAAQLLLESLVFCPDEPTYLLAYGRLLGRLTRFREAAVVLERAFRLAPGAETEAAWHRARALAADPTGSPLAGRSAAHTMPQTIDTPPACGEAEGTRPPGEALG